MLYENGWGTEQDLPRAIELYLSAAGKGEFLSCVFLGRAFEQRGEHDQALHWYQQALSFSDQLSDELLQEARAYVDAHAED